MHVAAEAAREIAADRKPQAGSRNAGAQAAVETPERAKRLVVLLGRNSWPVVVDRDLEEMPDSAQLRRTVFP